MATLRVVVLLVALWVRESVPAHLHHKTGGVGDVAIGHRRTSQLAEVHQDAVGKHPVPELLPMALPLHKGPLALPQSSPSKTPKATTLRKKRERPQTSSAVMGELGKILKDDDQETHKKRIPPDVKRQATLKPNETLEEGGDRKQQTFEDWLRDEYFRNMALSIATVKRKRSSLQDGRRKRSSKHDDTLDMAKEAKLRLQSLENAVLADALSEIVSRRQDPDSEDSEDFQRTPEESSSSRGSSGEDEGEGVVARRLAEAYYLERLRTAVDKLQEAQDIWGSFQDNGQDTGTEDMDQYAVDKRGNGKSSPAVSFHQAPVEEKNQDEEEMCPALRMLTSDCSSLEEVLSGGEMGMALRRACNKHEVCYSCGEAFGLTSASCDRSFLSDVSDACRACSERALGQLLLPLREQRVFYKRSVPPLCYRSPCVQAFLEEHY